MPSVAAGFMIFWLALSLAASLFVAWRSAMLGFLLGLFGLLVGWRIAGIYGVDLVTYPLLIGFLLYLLQFCLFARHSLGGDMALPGLAGMSLAEWHLTFLRLYIGLDFVPHFTEKLFAGPGPHMDDVKAFEQLGTAAPDALVWLAGLCELGAAIGIGLGVLCRLAAVGAALYLAIATVVGHHLTLGFVWANTGGGWEYPLLWMAFVLSFAYAGPGRFSVDAILLRTWTLPDWVRLLMRRRAK
jgi:putative oxidoreductase